MKPIHDAKKIRITVLTSLFKQVSKELSTTGKIIARNLLTEPVSKRSNLFKASGHVFGAYLRVSVWSMNDTFSLVLPALQSLWSPGLCEAVDIGTDQEPPSSSPNKCAFCNAVVPQNRMNSHLYSHCSPKNEASN